MKQKRNYCCHSCNRQFLLPGGSRNVEAQFKLQLESYGKKRVLRLMMFAIYSLIWQQSLLIKAEGDPEPEMNYKN